MSEHFPVRPSRASLRNALAYWVEVGSMPFTWTSQFNRQLKIVARHQGIRSTALYDQLRAEVA